MQSIRPPDKFDMVDMEGIDLLAVQGETIPGLYNKLVESITLCSYQCIYNWAFNGILIPPTYVEMEERSDGIWINEGVMVDEEDVVHIASIEPEPVIESLYATENGTYLVPEGVDGFNPVSVDVPSVGNLIENASVFRWYFSNGTTCWGVMKKLSGSVIGQNGNNSTASIVLLGDLMQVTFHGNSQNIEVVALSSIKLTAYRTSQTLGPATSTEYTMSQNDQQSFTTDSLYGGLYLEAESV